MDDSPAWDAPLAAIELEPGAVPPYPRKDLTMVRADERPTAVAYDQYVHLVELFKRHRYDEREIRAASPFVVEDPCFNALLVAAGEDLARIAEELGKGEDEAARRRAQAASTAECINARLWSGALHAYVPYDRVADRQVPATVAGGFVPLFARVPGAGRAQLMCRQLDSSHFWPHGGPGLPVPTCDRLSPGFMPTRYWRGPAWVNVNWLVARGLRRYRFDAYAEAIESATLDMVAGAGFTEYFDPLSGEGLGSDDFSWSAALVLDLLRTSTASS